MRHSAVGWPRIEASGSKTVIGLRVDDRLLDALDDWITRQGSPISRQDAIRSILEDRIC